MKKLKDMKIKSMLLTGFGSIIILSAIIIIFSILSINNVSKNTDDMYNKPYTANDLMWEIRKEIISVEAMLYRGIAAASAEESKAAIDSNLVSAEAISRDMQQLADLFTDADEKAMLDEIQTLLSQGSGFRTQINELILADKNAEALEVITNDYQPVFGQITAKVLSLSEAVSEDAVNFVDKSHRITFSVITFMLALLIIGIVVAVFIAGKITKTITEPIQIVMTGIQAVSEGNLSVEIPYESQNELGVLADCTRNTIRDLKHYIVVQTDVLQHIAQKDMTVTINSEFKGEFHPMKDALEEILVFMNYMLSRTREAVNQVTQASGQVAEISQSLASEATEQASATEEISATVAVVTENVDHNAENAKNVSGISSESVAKIEEGNECMEKLLAAMEEIGNQSNQISNIIQVIDDIASQTNLLALNASIEAARAGEHGKGFAVVAGEIGNLASESAKAAKNITELINSSLLAIKKGAALTDETAEVLQSVVSSVEKTSTLVEEISEACSSQAQSLEEISNGVNSIAANSGNTSASAEEASAASEELLAQAHTLEEMLAQYKLKNN